MDLERRVDQAVADRYRLERELGRGGMAVVYLAEDLRHHRRVAVKVLLPELAQALGADRFLREIRTVANLAHPNILPLHDSGEAEGLLYYVMPYVEGESLRARLQREKQLPVADAVRSDARWDSRRSPRAPSARPTAAGRRESRSVTRRRREIPERVVVDAAHQVLTRSCGGRGTS
jgi:hypothetical protein